MVVSEKIQILILGFGLGLTVFAATPAESTVEPIVEQRQSIFDVDSAIQPETEREEVIESGSGDSETESIGPKSLPLDPQRVEPTTITANAVQLAPPAAFSMQGKQYELDSFVSNYYRRPWTYPGGIDSHLSSHGVDSATIQGLSHSEKEKLHGAIHERKLTQAQTYSNCPDGVCPQYQTTKTRRKGLFGLRR
jgi:hypothetical protein